MEEIAKNYDPKIVDANWYHFWEKNNYFKCDPSSTKKPYCIVIPPPNVTGVLHMGHALGGTLEDILIRWKRMLGFDVLWVPGTDHAGIATQTVVERNLIKTIGKRRGDFTREEFLKHVWEWKEKSESLILNQFKKLGCSCDWSRLRFTMDEGNNRAVQTMFKKLFDDGLIYRGDYLVNWDPVTQTALADDEVEYEEQKGFLYYFKYPLVDRDGYIYIATTRPETMLGDVAIAVSPKDPKWSHMIGKMVNLPLMDRQIPIIGDDHVDPEFGTGMVKITPAHDPNDYEIGTRHNLPFINIMEPNGTINKNGGKFAGLSMAEARKAVVQEMKDLGLVEKIEPYTNRVGVSYRSKAIIEPYLSKQWFVRMSHFKDKMREAVQEEKVSITPQNWQHTYFHWIDNLRDWCISRQLWWGHRIPIWYNRKNPDQMICHIGDGSPSEALNNPEEWIQDPDVLDTWFSSALWPFATLGWPDKTPELIKYYPNSTMVTGHDILFFWVARMILMGEYALGTPPFPEVYLHSLIFGKSYWREKKEGGIEYVTNQERIEYDLGKPLPKDVFFKWEKMSKSKGNVIDPMEIIDQYGTDAIRMALCASASGAWQIDLDRRRFEEFKNFTNKIWNGARFVFMNLEDLTANELSKGLDTSLFTLEDRWILSVLNRTIQDVNKNLETYQFDQAAAGAYDFFWDELCSYYLEITKPVLFGKIGTKELRKNKQKLLVILLSNAIRLIHPMAPFITEELFQLLKKRFDSVTLEKTDLYTEEMIQALKSPACIIAPYPKMNLANDQKAIEAFQILGDVVYCIRNIRGEMKIPPGALVDVLIIGTSDIILETAVQDGKAMQDFESEGFPIGAEHSQKVKAAPIGKPYGSKTRVALPSRAAVSRIIEENKHIIAALVKTNTITFHLSAPENIGFASTAMVHGLKVMIPMPEGFMEAEKLRLEKEKEKTIALIDKTKLQLENKDFIDRAPLLLVEKLKATLLQAEDKLKEISAKLNN